METNLTGIAMGQNERICFAKKEQKEEIVEIWQECFGDEREYIAFYLRHRFTEQNMLIYEIDGKPVSMMSLLPVFLCLQGKRIKGYYIYAVATRRVSRGRGFAAALIETAAQGPAPLLLKPGEGSLYPYYQKLGFETAFYEETAVYQRNEILGAERLQAAGLDRLRIHWEEAEVPDYRRIRDQRFRGEGYVMWEEGAIAYALLENAFFQGKAVRICTMGQGKKEREDVVLARIEDRRLTVRETTVEKEQMLPVLYVLLSEVFAEEAIDDVAVHFPSVSGARGLPNRAGMIRYGKGRLPDRNMESQERRMAAIDGYSLHKPSVPMGSWYLNLTLD